MNFMSILLDEITRKSGGNEEPNNLNAKTPSPLPTRNMYTVKVLSCVE